jgi:hypothetical protein
MSSGGGGKGGGKKTTTETTVPEWVRAPADRNLQRAEALQQIEYMPYYGAEVAAFNPNQEMAMQNNANAASAFGLLAPTDAMAGMPTPTTFANGMKGYNSMPLYDQAMTDLKANYGDTVDAYDSLFGNAVPANAAPQYGGGGGGGGGVSFGGGGNNRGNAPLNTPNLVLRDKNGTVMNSPAPATTINYNPPSTPVGNAPINNTPTFNFKPPARKRTSLYGGL